jgi:hypothetical protein
MIRLKCPKCEKKLGVDDSKAGGVATCPDCGQKFRIPGAKSAAASREKSKPEEPAAARKPAARGEKPAAKPAAPARPSRPKEDWEEQDSSPYEVLEQDEATEEAKLVARDSFRDKEYEQLRKKKARELQLEDRRNNMAFFGSMFLLWIALSIITFMLPHDWSINGVIPFGVAWFMILCGRLWCIVLGFKESVLSGILVLLAPFYDIYFGIKFFGVAGKAMILTYVAWGITATVLAIGHPKLTEQLQKYMKGDYKTIQSSLVLPPDLASMDAASWSNA